MDKINFLFDDTVVLATVYKISENVIKFTCSETLPEESVLLSGFNILNEHNGNNMSGNYYHGYNTIYKNIDDKIVLLSNNGSVYDDSSTPSVSENTTVELTPEELEQQKLEKLIHVKQLKIEELSNICQEKIEDGIYVDNKKYSYTIQDQSNILNAMNLAKETGLEVPYHADDEPCTLYDYSTIASIYMQQQMNLTENQTYFNQLKQYINSINDVEQTNNIIAIVYGQELTGEYLDTYNTIIAQSQKILEQLILSESLNVSKK